MDYGVLLSFVGAAMIISLVPGPDMFYVMANGLASGVRAGMVAAVGMSTGMLVHTCAAVLGLSALLQAAPAAMDAVRYCGIVFLLYLAFDALRGSGPVTHQADPDIRTRSLGKIFSFAVLTNVSNPKVILFYLAFVPQFTTRGSALPMHLQLLVLGGVLIAVGLAVDLLSGFVSGRLSDLLLRRGGVQRWMERVSAAVFGGLAVRLAVDDLKP